MVAQVQQDPLQRLLDDHVPQVLRLLRALGGLHPPLHFLPLGLGGHGCLGRVNLELELGYGELGRFVAEGLLLELELPLLGLGLGLLLVFGLLVAGLTELRVDVPDYVLRLCIVHDLHELLPLGGREEVDAALDEGNLLLVLGGELGPEPVALPELLLLLGQLLGVNSKAYLFLLFVVLLGDREVRDLRLDEALDLVVGHAAQVRERELLVYLLRRLLGVHLILLASQMNEGSRPPHSAACV